MPYVSTSNPTVINSTQEGRTVFIRAAGVVDLPTGKQVTKLGCYSTSPKVVTLKIYIRHSSSNYEVVESKSINHSGGGWQDVELDTPYVVSGSNLKLAAYYTSGDLDMVESTDKAFVAGANVSGTCNPTESGGYVPALRAFYEDAPGGGGEPETGNYLVAGILEKSPSGWQLLTAGNHLPVNVASVSVTGAGATNGYVTLTFSHETAKIHSFLIQPNWVAERGGWRCAPSVSRDEARIYFHHYDGTAKSPNNVPDTNALPGSCYWFHGVFTL